VVRSGEDSNSGGSTSASSSGDCTDDVVVGDMFETGRFRGGGANASSSHNVDEEICMSRRVEMAENEG
jgi:hypothetical protein